MKKVIYILIIFAILSFFLPVFSFAQQDDANINKHLQLRFKISSQFSWYDKYWGDSGSLLYSFPDGGGTGYMVNSFQIPIFFSIGLFDLIEVGLTIPFSPYQHVNSDKDYYSTSFLGDIEPYIKFSPYSLWKDKLPYFNVAVSVFVGIPTGTSLDQSFNRSNDSNKFFGTGGNAYIKFRINVDFYLLEKLFYVDFAFQLQPYFPRDFYYSDGSTTKYTRGTAAYLCVMPQGKVQLDYDNMFVFEYAFWLQAEWAGKSTDLVSGSGLDDTSKTELYSFGFAIGIDINLTKDLMLKILPQVKIPFAGVGNLSTLTFDDITPQKPIVFFDINIYYQF